MAHYKPYEKDRRAQKRIQGEDVFGNKIKAVTPAIRGYTGKKVKGDASYQSTPGYQTPRLQTSDFDVSGASSLMDMNLRGVPMRFRTAQQEGGRRVHRTSGSSEFSDDSQKSNGKPVDLIVSNLDPTIGNLNLILTNMIKEYALILSIKVCSQREGYPIAMIKVNSQRAAQFVISQLHRKKVGHKRILISYAQSNQPDPDQLRAMVINILQEVPDNTIPLFKLLKLLETRYHCTVSLNEVNKLKDVCKITDNLGSRMISLASKYKASPPPNLSQVLVPYCTIHCAKGLPDLGWGELGTAQNLNVMISLEMFTVKLHSLLDLHLGSMHLLSFQFCYEQEFCEPLPLDGDGVPLEHLISCVRNVIIKWTGPNNNIKIITRTFTTSELDEEEILKSAPQQLAHKISLFSREVVDLLKTTNKCQLPLNKFIPAYHHHFGRQCHVADYGYTKLLDLLESIPHVAQIMGDASRKVLTLSHPSQMRRFTSDLLRVLKVQPFKQIKLDDYATSYEKVMGKSFNPVHYGLCTFRDLLKEVADNVVVITQNDEGFVMISVPKREQTAKEVAKTKEFAVEVVQILRHSQNFTMLFNQFVPAYHHNFGHQCRVSDYGFMKLVELFESIPDVVKIEQLPDGERTVSLTLPQSLKILGGQLKTLSESNSVYLENLAQKYGEEFGYQLRPHVYECDDMEELAESLRDYIEVVEVPTCGLHMIFPVDCVAQLKVRAWALLLDPPHSLQLEDFKKELESKCGADLPRDYFGQLRDVVSTSLQKDAKVVSLTDAYQMAAELYHVIYAKGGSVLFSDLEILYRRRYWKSMNLAAYDIRTLDDLCMKFDFLFSVNGSQMDVLALNPSLGQVGVAVRLQTTKKWSQAPLRVMQLKNDSFSTTYKTPESPSSVWDVDSPDKRNSTVNLNIQMPLDMNPQFMGNPFDLISPARTLYPHNLWGMSPEPTELPIPDKLMMKKGSAEDSGVKMESWSELDQNSSSGAGPFSNNNLKRQFRSYMSFEN